MSTGAGLQGVQRYLNAMANERVGFKGVPARISRPFVTIGRQAGAGGVSVANALAEILNTTADKQSDHVPWTVFDRNLVEVVIAQHSLESNLSRYMDEGHVNAVQDLVGDILGLHPARDTLVAKTNETIITLAKMGRCILIGRGSGILTRSMPGGRHVRVVADAETRLARIQEEEGVDAAEAAATLNRIDRSRRDYIRDNFGADVGDPQLYDLVINTGRISVAQAASMIAGLVGMPIAATR